MARVEEGGVQAGREHDGSAIARDAAEAVEGVERVEQRIERLDGRAVLAPARGAARAMARVLLLQMRAIEHHETAEFARRRCRDDFAPKAALLQQRYAPAMVEMGVSEQQHVDRGRVEAEGAGVLLIELAPALIEAAIDQDAFPASLDQMAGARDAQIGAVERKSHRTCLALPAGSALRGFDVLTRRNGTQMCDGAFIARAAASGNAAARGSGMEARGAPIVVRSKAAIPVFTIRFRETRFYSWE